MDYSKLKSYPYKEFNKFHTTLERVERRKVGAASILYELKYGMVAEYKPKDKLIADCSSCRKKKEIISIHSKVKREASLRNISKFEFDSEFFLFCKSCMIIERI